MQKIKWIGLLALTLLFLAACSAQAETINEDPINNIEFDEDSNSIIVDTDRIVIATKTYNVQFIETTGDEFTIHENNNTTKWLFEEYWDYTILVPAEQIKEISRQYAEAFNRTLPIETPASEE